MIRAILVILILLGAYVRLTDAMWGSFALTYDVGRDMLALHSLVYEHRFTLIGPTTGLQGVFYGPWWYWLLAVPYWLSSGNVQGVALFMGLTGVATIYVAYYVGKTISSQGAGLLFAAFVTFSPSLIGPSTQIWNPNVAPLVLVSILYVMNRILSSKKDDSLLWFGIVGLLVAYTFDSVEIVYGGIQCVAVIVFLIAYVRKRMRLSHWGMFFGGIIIVELPRIVFELRHHFLMETSIVYRLLHPSYSDVHTSFFQHMSQVLFLVYSQAIGTFFPSIPILSSFLILLILAGSVWILLRKKTEPRMREMIFFSFCMYACFIGILFFFRGTVWSHFIIGLPLVLLLLSAIVACEAYRALGMYAKKLQWIFGIILVFGIAISAYEGLPSGDTHDPATYQSHMQIVKFVYAHAYGKPFSYLIYNPTYDIYNYDYAYVFMWYAQNNHIPKPVAHAPLRFYLIEQDSDIGRQGAWIQAHANDGTMIQQVSINGMTVQVRSFTHAT